MKILICNLFFVELSSDENCQWIYERNIRVAPVTYCIQTFLFLHMWVLAPCLRMSGFFLAHVSAKSPSNISTNPSDVLSKVLEPKHNLKITSQSPPPLICLKIAVLREGGPKLFGMWNPYIFSYNSSSIHNNVCWLVHDL